MFAGLGQRTKWLGGTGAGTRLKTRKMEAGDDSPEFSLQWALKDIRLALDAADRPLPLVEAVRDRWAELDEAGLGGLDVAAARHGLDKPDAAAR